jgi:hypothetical protein
MLSIPIPDPSDISLENITSYDDIDAMVRKGFELKESEWTLVEDLFNYSLSDFKDGGASRGRAPTSRMGDTNQADALVLYCDAFLKVLRAGFGDNIYVSATVYSEKEAFLPIRMIAMHFDSPENNTIRYESITCPDLLLRLQELNAKFMDTSKLKGGIFYQRIARVYDTVNMGDRLVPTVYLIKPDQIRYWTRSMAFRDADDVVGDALLWQKAPLQNPGVQSDTESVRA